MDRLLSEIVMTDTHDIDEDVSYFWIIIALSVVLCVLYIISAIVLWNGICLSSNLSSCTYWFEWTRIPNCFKFCRRQLVLPVVLPVSSSKSSNISENTENTLSQNTTNLQKVSMDTKNPKLKKGISRKEYFKQ